MSVDGAAHQMREDRRADCPARKKREQKPQPRRPRQKSDDWQTKDGSDEHSQSGPRSDI
ncbi:MAG: hypothetical protein ACJAVR_004126 [Paracoccaceae bacterium]|jgi:hypothetical protein